MQDVNDVQILNTIYVGQPEIELSKDHLFIINEPNPYSLGSVTIINDYITPNNNASQLSSLKGGDLFRTTLNNALKWNTSNLSYLCDGNSISIVYGGSVSTNNAASLSKIDGVDGFLIGGASLEVDNFYSIYKKL